MCSPRLSGTHSQPAFDKQGHRGCRGLIPENTIPAMLRAIDEGVTTLEMDVVVSKDKMVLLSHEPWMNAEITTKPDGLPVKESESMGLNIYQMNYAEVKTFDVGMKPHPRFPLQQKMKLHKPLLSELIVAVESYTNARKTPPQQYNIEIKSQPLSDNMYHPLPPEFVDLVIPIVIENKIEKRTIIQSFDIRPLQYLHKKWPDIRTALLIEEKDTIGFDKQIERIGFVPSIYSPHYSLVTSALVSQCRDRGIRIIPWTVNKFEDMKKLKALGVDGIISDFPNLFSGL